MVTKAVWATALGILTSLIGKSLPADIEYDIRVTLNHECHKLIGTQKTTFKNTTGDWLREIHLWLLGNQLSTPNPHIDPLVVEREYWQGFDPGWTEIFRVRDMDGNELSFRYEKAPEVFQNYSLDKGILIVELEKGLSPGDTIVFDIDFETKFPNGYLGGDTRYLKDTYTWRFNWNPCIRMYKNGNWADGYSIPAADYRVELRVPREFVVASGADVQNDEVMADEKLIVMESSQVRSIPLAMSKDFKVVDVSCAIPIRIFYLPDHAREAVSYGCMVPEIINYYMAKLGGFPRRRLVIVDNEDVYGAMAADGFVLLSFRYKDVLISNLLDRVWEFYLAHEIAHQYFGISVGVDFDRDNFLSEAFAQYLSIAYFETKYGGKGGNVFDSYGGDLIQSLICLFVGEANFREHFVELPYREIWKDKVNEEIIKKQKDLEYAEAYDTNIYCKGYLVLRNLAYIIGEDNFWRLLGELWRTYEGRVMPIEDFERFILTNTNLELDSFLEDCLHGRGFVDYRIKKIKNRRVGDGYLTEIEIENRGEIDSPIDIELKTTNGTIVKKTFVDTTKLEVLTEEKVREVVLDPDSKIPDIQRLNNGSKRRVKFLLSTFPFFPPSDAYFLAPDWIGLGLTFGYLHDFYVEVFPTLDAEGDSIYFGGGVVFVSDMGWDRLFYSRVAYYGTERKEAEVGYLFSLHRAPNLGHPGKLNLPTHLFSISVARIEPAPKIPYYAIRSEWTLDHFLKKCLLLNAGLQLSPPKLSDYNFFKLGGWGVKYFKTLVPNLFLSTYLTGERIFGTKIPNHELPSLEGLILNKEMEGDASVIGEVFLLYPIIRGMETRILNLVILEALEAHLGYEGGRLYKDGECIEKEDAARIEASLGFATFAGYQFSVTLGYCHSLTEDNKCVYFGLSDRMW